MELSLSKLPVALADWRIRRRVRRARSSASGTSTCPRCSADIDDAADAPDRAAAPTSPRASPPRGGCREFQAQVTELESRLENLRQVLPEEKDVADILRRIQGLATQSNLAIQRFTPAGRCSRSCMPRCRTGSRRGDVPQPRRVLRPDQQVPANHQHQRHHDHGEAAGRAEPHHRRRVRGHDVRAAGRCDCRQGRDGAEAAVTG